MPLHGCIVTCTLHLYALELHGIQVCGVECHALVVNSVDFSSALKTTPSSSGRSRHAPAPVQGKKQKPHKHKNRQKRWSLSKGRACWSPWTSMLFARFSHVRNSASMLFAVFSSAQLSVTMLFAVFSSAICPLPYSLRCFRAPRCPLPCYLRCFHAPRCPLPCYLRCFHAPRCPLPCYLRCFQTPSVSAAYYICTTNSRLSSHGSSACPRRTTFVLQNVNYPATGKLRGRPWRTTFVLQKLTFQTRGSSGRPRRTPFVLQKSTFQPRKLRVSAAYYVCTTKIDFPATEAPGVRGVLRLYYKK